MASAASGGFRPLQVIAKVRESRTITSFHLQPTETGGWRHFEPGQFLVFRFAAANERGHVLRTSAYRAHRATRGATASVSSASRRRVPACPMA